MINNSEIQEQTIKQQINIDTIIERFNQRYIIKKRINAIICFFIAICGVSAVLYSIYVNGMVLIDRLRYMTFNATIFTSIVSFIFAIICLVEASERFEVTNRGAYFLRLSSAVTELIVLSVALFGLTSLVPDHPDVTSFTGCIMHIIIPIVTVLSFILNDAPIGKLKPWELLYGTGFTTIYVFVMFLLFKSGKLKPSQAPYSFMNFEKASVGYILSCLFGVYFVGCISAAFLSYLNRKYSWIWFRHIT